MYDVVLRDVLLMYGVAPAKTTDRQPELDFFSAAEAIYFYLPGLVVVPQVRPAAVGGVGWGRAV